MWEHVGRMSKRKRPDWRPKNPRLPPGVEKSLFIDRVRVDRETWRKYQLGFAEARRLDPALTWSAFLRAALDDYCAQFLQSTTAR